ncbi:MAG TPA: cation diffusion facilitator family transporter [Gemmatimonadales bacterium]|nr:cation diffusion facilitator family transporter [Gemmatimonadales bacterium]
MTEQRRSLRRYAVISILAALATIGLKGWAYAVTGSVGLLSDAFESLVNLAAAVVALIALTAAARPEDEDHRYGHSKAEYFSSGFEGALIMLAAASILYASIRRLIEPRTIEQLTLGVGISVAASVVNLLVARVLFRAARRHQSITLEADAHHLMTDVWTSAGVIIGIWAASATGWQRLDPIVAIAVALNIVYAGVGILKRSLMGLLDTAIPDELQHKVTDILVRHTSGGVRFHALRTRQAGAWRFIDFHVLVPGNWSVKRGHDLLERLEEEVREAVPNSTVFTHLEPVEDPVSWEDTRLERKPGDSAEIKAPEA